MANKVINNNQIPKFQMMLTIQIKISIKNS